MDEHPCPHCGSMKTYRMSDGWGCCEDCYTEWDENWPEPEGRDGHGSLTDMENLNG